MYIPTHHLTRSACASMTWPLPFQPLRSPVLEIRHLISQQQDRYSSVSPPCTSEHNPLSSVKRLLHKAHAGGSQAQPRPGAVNQHSIKLLTYLSLEHLAVAPRFAPLPAMWRSRSCGMHGEKKKKKMDKVFSGHTETFFFLPFLHPPA